MARYERSYNGERMTERLSLHVTPSLRAKLEAAAAQVGARTLNGFVNELLADRVTATVAGVRRNPEAAAVKQELNAAARADNAVGNLLNQLMRHLHSTGGDPQDMEYVREALARYLKAADLYAAALEHVLSL